MQEVLLVELGIDATNDQILDQMRIMKRAREEDLYKHIVCVVRGFDGDSRELPDIPEVRAFCRRLVNLGFISYLDFSTFIPAAISNQGLPAEFSTAWAAAEVWLCSEGRLQVKNFEITRSLMTELGAVLNEANDKADEILGASD